MNYRCIHCGALTDTTTHAPFCTCGGLFELDFTPPDWDAAKIDKSEWSLFRYRAFMAVDGDSWRDVTLGEGMTPTVQLEPGMYVKVDYMMPTLSFKDRGAAALVAHMKAIGVKTCVQDSSGNAGNSVAAYCARAGITCEIYVPEGTSPKKITMIEAHGAKAHVIPGTRDHCADVCRAKVEQEGVYYANHVYNPFFYEGTKTYIYEVFEQLGRIPANLVIPVGNGTLFLGAIFALEHLQESGVIDRFPQIIALQSQNCDPLLRAAEEKQLLSMIGEVDLGDGTGITLTYLGRFTVKMPWDADLAYKLENLRTVVDVLEDNEAGTINLMTDGKASFIPN